MAKKKQISTNQVLKRSLINVRLPHFSNIRFHYSWHNKNDSIFISCLGKKMTQLGISDHSIAYNTFQGFMARIHPQWCKCGRDPERYQQIAKLRIWMSALRELNKSPSHLRPNDLK